LEDWAHVAEIVGAVAVVVSVLYLGFQIGDNTKALRSQAHYNALVLLDRTVQMRVESPQLNRVLALCYAASDELAPPERAQCEAHTFMVFNGFEYLYYQNAEGAVPEQLWAGADASLRQMIRANRGLEPIWRAIAGSYGDPFRTYVANIFASAPRPAP
jgi:hypothetical protein